MKRITILRGSRSSHNPPMTNEKMRQQIIEGFQKYDVVPITVEVWGTFDWYICFKDVGFRVATGPKGTVESIIKTAMRTLKSLGKI